MGTSTALRQCRLLPLVILILCSASLGVTGGKALTSAEEAEVHGGNLSSQQKLDKADKYSPGGSSDKYAASYPASAFSYYSTYGYPGVPSNPFANVAGGGSSESSKTTHYNHFLAADPVYERHGKDFSTRTSNTMPMAMAASSNFATYGTPSHTQSKEVTGPEFGGLASASQGWSSSGSQSFGGKASGGWSSSGGSSSGWGGGGGGQGGGGGGWGSGGGGQGGGGWGGGGGGKGGGGGGWGGGGGGGGGWGGGGGGGGWGGGGGGGWMKAQTDKMESGMGLISMILLLILLQSVISALLSAFTTTTTTTTTMAGGMGRKKRDVTNYHEPQPQETAAQKTNRITLMVLPSLNVIAHARDGTVPLECTHREVCVANSIFVKELGHHGRTVGSVMRTVGSVMSSAITRWLKEVANSKGIDKHLARASMTGRNGHDCTVVYPLCKALGKNTTLPMLLPPDRYEEFTGKKPGRPRNPRPSKPL
ncbi:unnamed protein product [Allacma fusca]|uniref:Uncharacterized protein n=1 Tax=Allacma fusca TaxID=39272 RepID=A0A8J2P0T5_9HEXA|nr:unnamed protein product [Allacma fusca]